LTVGLKDIIEWYVEKNGMPAVMDLTFKKDNGQLHVEFSGGDERTRGMVDLIEHYAKKIDEDTGCVNKRLAAIGATAPEMQDIPRRREDSGR